MTGEWGTAGECAKIFELAFRAANLHRGALGDSRDTGGVIASIFEALQSRDENWIGFLRPDVSYDSAHIVAPV
jgi:hypothetical protein